MKRKASEVLSVGGCQIDEKGVEFRKRVAKLAGKEYRDTTNESSSSSKSANESSSSSKSVVVNGTFSGCNNVTYTNAN